jgi:hypothetical protein
MNGVASPQVVGFKRRYRDPAGVQLGQRRL